ncbi:NAD(P)H-binding protein, partial [Escherichia coli]|nr:NAD(P)H-binding protein [Escherichia coli]
MFVIFGATGRAGGKVARALLDQGETVRAAVRQPAKAKALRQAGAEIVTADLTKADDIAAALSGATAAFLLNPPPVSGDPFATTAVIAQALAEGARRAGLQKAVVLSSVGAQHADGTGVIATLHQMETAFAGAVPALTFLRAGYFVETWEEVADAAISDGVLPSFL